MFIPFPQDNGELETSIRSVLSLRGLQQPTAIVTKVVQLHDTMHVRFGVMLVGPTGGGKSECLRTLQGALTRLRVDMRSRNDKFQVGVAGPRLHQFLSSFLYIFRDLQFKSVVWCSQTCDDTASSK